ncbi:MAG: hypothetical protein M1321_02925 [Candidatus Marsarchaeota archaeon]|nr:hypothetical protein [Candidatus Marsarchaeota archaeon]
MAILVAARSRVVSGEKPAVKVNLTPMLRILGEAENFSEAIFSAHRSSAAVGRFTDIMDWVSCPEMVALLKVNGKLISPVGNFVYAYYNGPENHGVHCRRTDGAAVKPVEDVDYWYKLVPYEEKVYVSAGTRTDSKVIIGVGVWEEAGIVVVPAEDARTFRPVYVLARDVAMRPAGRDIASVNWHAKGGGLHVAAFIGASRHRVREEQ